jgi:hypothetical protein
MLLTIGEELSMRFILFSLASAFVFPALAAANPHCATAGPISLSGGTSPAPSAASAAAPPPVPIPVSLSGTPFVKHIASAGATITDLGIADGMHQIAARSGNQFMLFDVAPDGNAAVSGVPIEMTLAQLKTVAAGNITDIGSVHGLEGYFVRSGSMFQVFYATPDNQRVIPGVLWDASGKNITKTEVANIPGAIPTVEVNGPDGPAAAPAAELPLIQNATFGTIGNNPAKHLYMLIDPQCIYSIQAFCGRKPDRDFRDPAYDLGRRGRRPEHQERNGSVERSTRSDRRRMGIRNGKQPAIGPGAGQTEKKHADRTGDRFEGHAHLCVAESGRFRGSTGGCSAGCPGFR